MKEIKTTLESYINSQRDHVFDSFTLNGKQSFEDFKSQIEDISDPEITTICHFKRPAMPVYIASFVRYELKNHITIKVDEDIKLMMDQMNPNEFYELNEWDYVHSITGNKTTNDTQIVSTLKIDALFPIIEIIGNAIFLVQEDLNKNGPLYEPDISKDRNINLGHMLIGGKVCVVYIERIKYTAGQNREYHIHKSICPRLYKPNRHIIHLYKG